MLIGAVVTVLGSRGDDAPAGSPSAAPSPAGTAAAAPPAQAAQGGCRPTAADQTVPRTAPAGVTWEIFQGIAIPASRTAGPLIVKNGIARCFARTPTGALIAELQIGIRAGFGPAWRNIAALQLAPGPGRDRFLRTRARFTPHGQPGRYMQTAGFRYVTYSPQTAVIQYVSRAPDGGLWTSTATMVWAGGDWKLQVTPEGSTGTPAQRVPSLDGFVRWGGL
ncbi:hypothetical protein [Spirillospora sp. NPDC029432]|uniref:hypothetical protein n=1 Tax=Spirillospora sp. NPDC029432 TaxID=3154599 RepID=UPI0034521A45